MAGRLIRVEIGHNAHQLRRKGLEQIARVWPLPEPALVTGRRNDDILPAPRTTACIAGLGIAPALP